MGGTFVITNTDESGFMTADSESVVEYSGEIGFEPRMITADGYYWAQAYDEPHTASTQWFKKTYSVVEDTYVRGGSYMDVNYGLETKLEVKDAPGNSDYDRLAFMKFHLDDVELAAVQQVHLIFPRPCWCDR